MHDDGVNTEIGLWHDTDHGEVVLDRVRTFTPEADGDDYRDKAVEYGKAQNQQSVWDHDNAEEIPTGGTGRPSA